jgi:uncharacterized protein (TIGR02453 family)
MIGPAIFQFLKELRKNNSKEWFDINRERYSVLRKDFEQFINQIIAEIALFDRQSAQTTASASMFRINRDIRFSKNKEPYKTNFGAFISRGGRKGIHAGYYIHAEPGECFLAGGIYMPSAPALKAIRTEIFENLDEFRQIVNARDFIKHFGKEFWGEKLISAPKGFQKDSEGIEYLRYKHYTIVKNEPDVVYTNPAFIKEVKEVFGAMSAFNAFLNRAVDESEK